MNAVLNRIVLGLFLAIVLCGALTGCKHTAHGAGEDIEKMGEKIQDKTN
jgi:predicted small secreted protein